MLMQEVQKQGKWVPLNAWWFSMVLKAWKTSHFEVNSLVSVPWTTSEIGLHEHCNVDPANANVFV